MLTNARLGLARMFKAFGGIPRIEVIRVVALALFVTVLWCNVYNLTSLANWNTPLLYGGDAWWNLAMIKAYRDGEITPFLFQHVASLNAPFSANWNDYPISDKVLPYCVGLLARFMGLMPAFNFAALLAVVLAALAFYIVCRILRYQWMFGIVGAVMFAFSHYMSARQLAHLSLTYYWHIPLCMLVTWWCFDSRGLAIGSSRWWFAAAVAVVTGFQAIYYAFLFWQFLGFATVAQALRRRRAKAISVASIAATSLACTVLMAVPKALYGLLHGSNTLVVQRNLAGLEIYGLKLPELFLPPFHRWKAFVDYGQANYFQVSAIRGEMGSPYLGMIGIAGFVWLMGLGLIRLLDGGVRRIPLAFWQCVWIVVFSLIGGVNLLIGVSGLQLFRATNRFSIVLLCLALLFLTKQLGRMRQREYRLSLALLLLGVGLWDILPPFRGDEEAAATEKVVAADRDFVQRLEQRVPVGTMVFQLPVMEFPEVPPHLGVADYTYFRPFFYSRALHFSFGSNKGRARESWQRDVESLPAGEMADTLERYGFGAILIDPKGYQDQAKALLSDLALSGRQIIEQDETGEFVAVALRPAAQIATPEVPPFPGTGFYGWERNWREGGHTWSQGDATLVLTNAGASVLEKSYTFSLNTLSKRRVTIATSQVSRTVELAPGAPVLVGPMTLRLKPGETYVRFKTDRPAVLGPEGDPRMLAFSVAILPEASPDPEPVLGSGFYGWEGDWKKGAHSWSQGSATLVLMNATPRTIERRYAFFLNTTSERRVTVVTPTETRAVDLSPGNPVTLGPFTLRLAPGATPIRFETDRPAILAGHGDMRKITFSVVILPLAEGPAH